MTSHLSNVIFHDIRPDEPLPSKSQTYPTEPQLVCVGTQQHTLRDLPYGQDLVPVAQHPDIEVQATHQIDERNLEYYLALRNKGFIFLAFVCCAFLAISHRIVSYDIARMQNTGAMRQ